MYKIKSDANSFINEIFGKFFHTHSQAPQTDAVDLSIRKMKEKEST
jgi:hypothetical protein